MSDLIQFPPRPPENRDAEQALLGALMINNKLFDLIAGICSADHFASAMHSRLFAQLVILIATGKRANPVTLKSFAETDAALQASGGKTYLVQLTKRGMVLDPAGAVDYASIIASLAKRRALLALLSSEVAQISRADDNQDVSDILARVKGGLDELARAAPSRPSLVVVCNAGDIDPTKIPPRGWLLGTTFCRGFISGLNAGGSGGKTTVRYTQYLAVATSKPITGEHVHVRGRVLIVCLEDNLAEVQRRVAACMLHHG